MNQDTIEQFCREFFRNEKCEIRVIIRDNKHLFTGFNMTIFTEENFDGVIQKICMGVFTLRPVHDSYITAVMGFALEVDYHLQELSWYQLDNLINAMVNVLDKVGIIPKTANYI